MTEFTATFLNSDNDGNADEQRHWYAIDGPDTATEVALCHGWDGATQLIDDAGYPLTEGDAWANQVRRAIERANT